MSQIPHHGPRHGAPGRATGPNGGGATRHFAGRSHQETRSKLRTVGPIVLGAGVLLLVIGVGSFFSSFGSFEPPHYFWCAFLGIPLIGVGGAICQFAYMGAVSRYVAEEVAPVATDAANYVAREASPAIEAATAAVARGLRTGATAAPAHACPGCGAENGAGAHFCKKCGWTIGAASECAECGARLAADGAFCDQCGARVAAG